LSATTLTGLFLGSKFLIETFALLLIVAPRHPLGLKGDIGVTASRLDSKSNTGPRADKLYAVLPAGVATSVPSQIISF
jgi:hypothetical protein